MTLFSLPRIIPLHASLQSATITAVAAALLLCSCAAPVTRGASASAEQVDEEVRFQRQLVVEQNQEHATRLFRVASKIQVAAAPLCGARLSSHLGLMAGETADNPEGELMRQTFKLPAGLAIQHVLPASPAARAGLQQGDVLVMLQGQPVASLKEWRSALDQQALGVALKITVKRAGRPLEVQVLPDRACAYALQMDPSSDLNAYADGDRIVINQGMMNFVRNDEELALVVSHELAHNLMRHIDAKKTNAMGGMLADLALAVATRGTYSSSLMMSAAGQAYSQEFESEADYVGLYLMARAGMRIDEAPQFWRRMAVANPGNIKGSHRASHPSTAQRMVALSATAREIKAKQALGEDLLPNLKEGAVLRAPK